MPTIIDALVVRLGLDSRELDSKAAAAGKKLKDVEQQSDKTEKSVKKIGATSKESASSVGDLTRAVGAFLTLIGGTLTIKQFISDQIESTAALDRFAKNLGLSVSTVSAWGNAVEEMGGNAKALQGSMDMLSKAQTELRLTGQSSLIPYFSALGVSLATVGGQARPVDQILLDLSDRFSRMDRTTANNMGRMMGIDQDTLNLLLQGRHEVELMIVRQKEYGEQIKKFAPEASKLQRSIVDLKQSFTLFGLSLLERAAPALETILGWLQQLGNWINRNKEFVGDFLAVVAFGIGAVAIAALPLNALVLAVAALAAGIVLLYQDYQTWKRGGDSLIDWAKWEPGITLAIKGIERLAEVSERAFKAIGGLKTLGMVAKSLWDSSGPGILLNAIAAATGNKSDTPEAKAQRKAASSGAAPTISEQARAQAARVSKMTGMPADLVYSWFAHETGNFTNRGATQLHNLAGVNVPGGKGQDYRNFKSFDEFGDYLANVLLRDNGLYPGAKSAKTGPELAAILKAGGYYSGNQSDYGSDIQRRMNGIQGASSPLLAGIAGASSSAAAAGNSPSSSSVTTDKSVSVTTGPITVNTQATDAPGIVRDMWQSMNFLFTSQANAGLF